MARPGNRVDVVVRGVSGNIWWRTLTGTTWSAWVDLGGHFPGSPAIASSGPDRLVVVVRGDDNTPQINRLVGSAWTGWRPLDGSILSDPAIVHTGGGRYEMVATGANNAAYHRVVDENP